MTRDTLYGSAQWATDAQLQKSGLLNGKGLYFGESAEGKALYLSGDQPLITFGGSGSGKGRDIILHNVLSYDGHMFVNDPKGELAAVALHSHHLQEKHAYCINPFEIHAGAPWYLPSHNVNPLDILKPDSITLVADCKLLMEMMLPSTGQRGKDNYWIEKPRDWGTFMLVWLVQRYSGATLPQFYDLVSSIRSDPPKWKDYAAEMSNSPNVDVRRVVGEIQQKQDKAGAEFEGIIGGLSVNLSFMGDPTISRCLEGGDFSLSVITNPIQPVNVYLIFPAEYMQNYVSFLRLMIGVSTLYKQRTLESPPVIFLIDEAAQLGYFEVLARCYSYGRGAGIRTWAFFQSMGQIEDQYGRDGGRSMVSSAQVRQFFGVRDIDTARVVSEMVGESTVFYDDPVQKDHHRTQGTAHLLQGAGDAAAVMQAMHHFRAASEKSIAGRDLINTAEVLQMEETDQIAFVGGVGCPPILAKKRPYFSRTDLAGRFLPNPHHSPTDKVKVATRWREAEKRVVSSPVPKNLESFPQYKRGFYSRIDL